ncbi:MAG: RNA polymerase sigma factor [Planctomycetota bacterium]
MSAATAALATPGFVQRLSTAPGVQAARKAPAAEQVCLSDEVLFQRALGGDQEALGSLVANYQKTLFGLLVRLTNGDWHTADDLFQETFLHALRAGASFDQKMGFKPWVTAIAVNLVRDEARKRKVRGEVPLEAELDDQEYERAGLALDDNPREHAERQDEEQRVRRALARLTLLEREVVLLHFFDGMTLAEAASSLGVALGTVKSRLHSALTRLNNVLSRKQA